MYRLKFKPETESFEIHSSKYGAFSGPFLKIYRKAVEMGVEPLEIKYALEEFAKNDHNVAEFGIWGKFIFSKSE